MPDSLLIRCPSCGATNRVPRDKIKEGLAPVCGRCKTLLPLVSKPVTVTDATFITEVERSPIPVLLDLWAPWCGPCLKVGPIIDELASEMTGRVRFAKLNIDDNPATPPKFNIRGIPTLILFKNGTVEAQKVGAVTKSQLAAFLDSNL